MAICLNSALKAYYRNIKGGLDPENWKISSLCPNYVELSDKEWIILCTGCNIWRVSRHQKKVTWQVELCIVQRLVISLLANCIAWFWNQVSPTHIIRHYKSALPSSNPFTCNTHLITRTRVLLYTVGSRVIHRKA